MSCGSGKFSLDLNSGGSKCRADTGNSYSLRDARLSTKHGKHKLYIYSVGFVGGGRYLQRQSEKVTFKKRLMRENCNHWGIRGIRFQLTPSVQVVMKQLVRKLK